MVKGYPVIVMSQFAGQSWANEVTLSTGRLLVYRMSTSISETAALVGCSHTTVSRVYHEWKDHVQTSRISYSDLPHVVDPRCEDENGVSRQSDKPICNVAARNVCNQARDSSSSLTTSSYATESGTQSSKRLSSQRSSFDMQNICENETSSSVPIEKNISQDTLTNATCIDSTIRSSSKILSPCDKMKSASSSYMKVPSDSADKPPICEDVKRSESNKSYDISRSSMGSELLEKCLAGSSLSSKIISEETADSKIFSYVEVSDSSVISDSRTFQIPSCVVDKTQNVTTKMKTPPKLESPCYTPPKEKSLIQKAETPCRTPPKRESPCYTPPKTETSCRTPPKRESPCRTPLKTETPCRTPRKIDSPCRTPPSRTPSKVDSPCRTPPKTEIPCRTPPKVETPCGTPEAVETPCHSIQKRDSGCYIPSKKETPCSTQQKQISQRSPSVSPFSSRSDSKEISPCDVSEEESKHYIVDESIPS
ncbi:fibrous sheath CABYR-binding protein-like [Centruroides sculpturatus]|uniref:fibrous sheath CABYR-binding protein-like n=1 Tax=Centruroides sculpturatus TaxID=218467 RepID=UPI000C6CBE82|nr:fibrous sheath CABYR-binding protein-like [Centruroides sculpturatus]